VINEVCQLCGRPLEPSGCGLFECGDCGLAVKAEKQFLAPSYESGLAEGIYSSAKQALFGEALDFLDRALPARGRLLDIGCAGGEMLETAAGRGWLAEGVEIDPALRVKSSARGFEVYSRPVEEAALAGGAYDAITVFEVFCLMANPAAAAAELHRLLKPGGVIYIREFNASFHLLLYSLGKTGVFKPLGARPSVIHNFNFRAGTLRAMLLRAGFRDIRIRNSRPTSGDPYRTGGRLGGFLTGALKVLYYWLAQALWYFTLGRVFSGSALIVTARKWPSVAHRA